MKTNKIFSALTIIIVSLLLFACASKKEEVKNTPDDLSFSEFDEQTIGDESSTDNFSGDEVAAVDDNVTVDVDESGEDIPALPGENEVYDESIGSTPAKPLPRPHQRVVVNKPYSRSAVGYPEYNTSPGPKASGGTYIVRKGDTLWGISRKYGVPVRSLAKANGMSVNVPIKIGQRLVIPDVKGKVIYSPYKSGKSYVVKKGDSYYKIAKKFGLNYKELMSYNNASSSSLKVGQVIKIP